MEPDNKDAPDNYGRCISTERGRQCQYIAARCEWNLCEACCTRLHLSVNLFKDGHRTPWAKPGRNAMGFRLLTGGKENVFSPLTGSEEDFTTSDSRLPVIYQEKAKVPKPKPLVETTQQLFKLNAGDHEFGEKGGDPKD